MIEVRKGFSLKIALDAICKLRTVNPDGSISSYAFNALGGWESYLSTALTCKGKTQAFVDLVVKRTVNKRQNLSEAEFIKDCNEFAKKLTEGESLYRVAFPIWPANHPVDDVKRIRGCTIRFSNSPSSSFNRKIIKSRSILRSEIGTNYDGYFKFSDDLPLAICSVKASSASDAYQKAEEAISVLLGIYALHWQRGYSILPENPRKPVGSILIAPFSTVHDETGRIAEGKCWYEVWTEAPAKRSFKNESILTVRSSVNKFWRSVLSSNWTEDVELALIKYYRSVANPDPERAFLETWQILERIGGSESTKGEVIVKRAASFFDEFDSRRQIGEHLRTRRNFLAHGKAIDSNDGENLRFEAMNFVRPMLQHFVLNHFKFKEIPEFWEFCDLPRDFAKRKRLLHILKSADRFHA